VKHEKQERGTIQKPYTFCNLSHSTIQHPTSKSLKGYWRMDIYQTKWNIL